MNVESRRLCVALLLSSVAACGGGGGGGGGSPSNVEYTLGVAVSGTGTVASNPAGIAACGPANAGTCSADFASGTSVLLTATPGMGSAFRGWAGACTPSATVPTQCTATMNADKGVVAVFDPLVVGGGTGSILALTKTGKLLSFNLDDPADLNSSATVSGLGTGEKLLAIDYRPSNGLLYGVSRTSTGAGRLYVIDEGSAEASLVGELSGANALPDAAKYEMAFDPSSSLIRLVADTGSGAGKAFSINPDGNGALTPLSQPAGVSVGSLAFTNGFTGTRSTTGYGLDSDADALKTLSAVAADSVSFSDVTALTPAIPEDHGFAIDGETGTALVAFRSTVPTLYSLNLSTGGLAALGQIGDGVQAAEEIVSLVVDQPRQPQVFGIFETFANADLAPAPDDYTAGLTLVRFNASSPDSYSKIADLALGAGETMTNLAVRPSTGVLYGLSSAKKLYTISTVNGAAAEVCTIAALTTTATIVGFDFNPATDAIRISGGTISGDPAASANHVISPLDCSVVGTPLAALQQTPFKITSAAFLNNVTSTPSSTAWYGIDSQSDQLFTIDAGTSPTGTTNGRITKVADLGFNASAIGGFEIAGATNTAYATLTDGTNSTLYTLNLSTGGATKVGTVNIGSLSGFSGQLVGLAAQAVSTPSVSLMFGATDTAAPDARLVAFDPNTPGSLVLNNTIGGLAPGEKVLAIDFRYSNSANALYALVRGANGTDARLYTVSTGAAPTASPVGVSGNIMSGMSPYQLEGTHYGMDVDPTNGNIRIVSDANENLSVAITPLAANATVVSDLAQTPFPTANAAAYSRSFEGSTNSTFYLFDTSGPGSDRLMTVDADQTVRRMAASGIANAAGDYVGFDILGGHDGLALATEANCPTHDPICLTGTGFSVLFQLNLSSGIATEFTTVGVDDSPVEDTRILLRTLAIRFPQ